MYTREGNKGINLTLISSLTTGNLKLITALLQMINAGCSRQDNNGGCNAPILEFIAGIQCRRQEITTVKAPSLGFPAEK